MLDTVREREPVTDPWAELPGPAGPQAGQQEGLGRYMLLRQLGRGGMGVVLAAYDPSLNRKVAIKILLEGIQAASEGAARMQREAQAMARLSHPNVAQVYEVGEAQGRLYLVMEYVEGATLGAWLREGPRAMAEVLRVFMEAGRGLAAAHAAGLIHRDFKPENAMIGADGRVRVLDFGLSRSVLVTTDDATTQLSGSDPQLTITAVGTLIGTPAYMSAEQHMRLEVDARSDQFSFCVALYEALYGVRPFSGANLRELGLRVAAGMIAEPPTHTRVPKWLRQVILRGLRPDPAARWPDMDALLAALARDPRRTRRRWLVAGLAVVAVAGAGYGAAAYQVAQSQMCSGAAEELRAVWDPQRRAQLEQVVRVTGVGHADPLLASVTARLDAYAEQWVAGHTAACEAHRRGHASTQLFERKMACLRQRRTELGATVDVLTQTTADSVANLVEAAVLPPISSCEDDARLLADVPLPADPALADEVERMRARLARLQALERAGRHAEALAELEPELAVMQQIGDVPLLAAGHLLAGKLRMHRLDGEARADIERGLQLALEGRVDEIAAEALAIEIFVVGYVEQRPNEALNLAPIAWSLVRRVGAPAQLAALLHNNVAVLYDVLGDNASGIAELERGLALLDPRAEDPLRWVMLYNLAEQLVSAGEAERAWRLVEPVLQRLEQLHGPCHILVGSLRAIRGAGRRATADFAAASADYEQAVGCFRVAYPVQALMALVELVDIAVLAGDDAGARAYIARAEAIAAAAPEAQPHLVQLAVLRADLELRAGRHEVARGTLEGERARLLASQGAVNPILAKIETRLAIVDHHAGAHEAALEHLQRAVVPKNWSDERGLWAFTHAKVLHALGRERSQVATLVEQAVAEYRRAGAAHAPRAAEVAAWAAALPRSRG